MNHTFYFLGSQHILFPKYLFITRKVIDHALYKRFLKVPKTNNHLIKFKHSLVLNFKLSSLLIFYLIHSLPVAITTGTIEIESIFNIKMVVSTYQAAGSKRALNIAKDKYFFQVVVSFISKIIILYMEITKLMRAQF